MDARRLGTTFRRRKKPRAKRAQPPRPVRRPAGKRPRFRLAAYVARKFEENTNLATDSARIAFTIFMIAITLGVAHLIYRAWVAPEPPQAIPLKAPR